VVLASQKSHDMSSEMVEACTRNQKGEAARVEE